MYSVTNSRERPAVQRYLLGEQNHFIRELISNPFPSEIVVEEIQPLTGHNS